MPHQIHILRAVVQEMLLPQNLSTTDLGRLVLHLRRVGRRRSRTREAHEGHQHLSNFHGRPFRRGHDLDGEQRLPQDTVATQLSDHVQGKEGHGREDRPRGDKVLARWIPGKFRAITNRENTLEFKKIGGR